MGKIQSNIGLITGMPIGDTVDALMELSAKPREMLEDRTEVLRQEQIAVTELSALLLSVKFVTINLGKQELFEKKEIISSNPDSLSATITGDPPMGTYQFTPLQTVQNQQWLGTGLKSDTDALGGGTLSFRFGNNVQTGVDLEMLNAGEGITRGSIRITDRSGIRSDIDLSTARSIDDVLDAINANAAINVTAIGQGDGIRLIDNTGQSVSNLRVEEVGSGTTAASLGLAGIDVAASMADSADLMRLYDDLDLDLLNDGNGVYKTETLPDIRYTLSDGTTGTIDLSPVAPGSSEVDREKTLGDILTRLNEAEPGKLRFEIAPDGDRLMATDLTTGEQSLKLEAYIENAGDALADLGLDGEAVDGVIMGRRLLGGVKTVLLSNLNGGNGFEQLGMIELTDRSGVSDTVDLSGAETLQDVVDLINAGDVGLMAQINGARNGIELVDTTGEMASNLIVADADGSDSAAQLGIEVDADVDRINSGDMHLQVVSENTRLADYNGGAGVARGSMLITDSNHHRRELRLWDDEVQTIGDLIEAVRQLSIDVYAEINETGDGIRLVDYGDGAGELEVLAGTTSTAWDLHLYRPAENVVIDGQSRKAIDGSITRTIELTDQDSLEDLRQKVNELQGGVHATTFVDGSNRPFRLALVSDQAGKAGELVVDTSGIRFSMEEIVKAQDALLVFGDAANPARNILVSSNTNTFNSVLSGVSIDIEQPSDQPVSLTIGTSDVDIIANISTMVDNYNRFRDHLNNLTYYDPDSNTGSLLSGDSAALRVDVELSQLLSGRMNTDASVQTLAELGVGMKGDGTLSFDESKLKATLATRRDAVADFFTKEESGFAARFHKVVEQIAGQDVSLLAHRFKTLREKIDRNESRIEFLDTRLEDERYRLWLQFYRMELAIGKMQVGLSAIESINPVPPMT